MPTVVLGYVPKPEGEAALAASISEARLREADLVVVNSHRAHHGDAEARDRPRPSSTTSAPASRRPASSVDVRHPETGLEASEDLLNIAEEVGAELVVIGLRRRTPVGKLILGSNAQRILLDAPLPGARGQVRLTPGAVGLTRQAFDSSNPVMPVGGPRRARTVRHPGSRSARLPSWHRAGRRGRAPRRARAPRRGTSGTEASACGPGRPRDRRPRQADQGPATRPTSGAGGGERPRTSTTQVVSSHSQNAKYGTSQATSIFQTSGASPRAIPATTPHDPSQVGMAPVESMSHRQANAKLPSSRQRL